MLDTWEQKGSDTLTFEKEALPVGQFAKWTDGNEVQELNIRRGYLDKLLDDFKKFKKVGIRVPLFKTHKEDPDNDRGTIEGLVVKPNSKGVDSLHLQVKFNNTKARDQGIHNDVSVMCPPKFIDTKRNVYKFPLRHVALTSVPVIPGLDPFTPIILSFDTPSGLMLSKDKGNMNELNQILEALEITAEDGVDDASKLELILGKLKTRSKSSSAEIMDLSFPPILINQMAGARKSVIDGLVKDEALSITLGRELEADFCAEEAIICDLQLSHDEAKRGTEFDRIVTWVKKLVTDRPLKRSGRTETIKLSRDGDGKPVDNILVADAKARAERAKQRA